MRSQGRAIQHQNPDIALRPWPLRFSKPYPSPLARRPLTEADAVAIWIARWLRIRRKDLVRRYGCDPRRLYEIWEGERFPDARAKALELFEAALSRACSTGSISAPTSGTLGRPIRASWRCSNSCSGRVKEQRNRREQGENKHWTTPPEFVRCSLYVHSRNDSAFRGQYRVSPP